MVASVVGWTGDERGEVCGAVTKHDVLLVAAEACFSGIEEDTVAEFILGGSTREVGRIILPADEEMGDVWTEGYLGEVEINDGKFAFSITVVRE
jgi:hypothetical protein